MHMGSRRLGRTRQDLGHLLQGHAPRQQRRGVHDLVLPTEVLHELKGRPALGVRLLRVCAVPKQQLDHVDVEIARRHV